MASETGSNAGEESNNSPHSSPPATPAADVAASPVALSVVDNIANNKLQPSPPTTQQPAPDTNRRKNFIKKMSLKHRAAARQKWNIVADSDDEREEADLNRQPKEKVEADELKRKAEDGDNDDSVTIGTRRFKKFKPTAGSSPSAGDTGTAADGLFPSPPSPSRGGGTLAQRRAARAARQDATDARRRIADQEFDEVDEVIQAVRRGPQPPSLPRPAGSPAASMDTSGLDLLAHAAELAVATAAVAVAAATADATLTLPLPAPTRDRPPPTVSRTLSPIRPGPPARAELRQEVLRTWPRELMLPPFIMRDSNSTKERKKAEKERKKLRKAAGMRGQVGDGDVTKGAKPWHSYPTAREESKKFNAGLKKALDFYGPEKAVKKDGKGKGNKREQDKDEEYEEDD